MMNDEGPSAEDDSLDFIPLGGADTANESWGGRNRRPPRYRGGKRIYHQKRYFPNDAFTEQSSSQSNQPSRGGNFQFHGQKSNFEFGQYGMPSSFGSQIHHQMASYRGNFRPRGQHHKQRSQFSNRDHISVYCKNALENPWAKLEMNKQSTNQSSSSESKASTSAEPGNDV